MPSHDDDGYVAQVLQQLAVGDEARRALQEVVDLAVEQLDAVDHAGIGIRRERHRVERPVSTDPVVQRADALQHELTDGPGLDAVDVGETDVVQDLRDARRWPRWTRAAADLGLRSWLGVRLDTPASVVAVLDLYSRRPFAFGQDDVLAARDFAMNASTLLRQARQAEGLRAAVSTRHQIGLAQGTLMVHLRVGQQQASEVLRRISQQRGIALRDVASTVVEHHGDLRQINWSVPRR